MGEGGSGRAGGSVSPAFSAKMDLSFLMLCVGAIPVSLAKLGSINYDSRKFKHVRQPRSWLFSEPFLPSIFKQVFEIQWNLTMIMSGLSLSEFPFENILLPAAPQRPISALTEETSAILCHGVLGPLVFSASCNDIHHG